MLLNSGIKKNSLLIQYTCLYKCWISLVMILLSLDSYLSAVSGELPSKLTTLESHIYGDAYVMQI